MGSKGSDTQTMKQEPWSAVQQPLKNLYSTTQSALGNVQPYYPGQTYPNFTPLQEAGMLGNLDYAQNYYQPASMGYQQQLGQYMDAPLNITQDPAVQNMFAANADQVNKALTEQWLPAIAGNAAQVGQMGSSRQGIAQGLAAERAAQALTNANAQTALGAYGTASDLAGRAAGLMPAGLAMGFTPGDLAQKYGTAYQQFAGQGITEDMNRYAYPEQSLWEKLGTASNIYNGAGNYGTKTQEVPGSSPFADLLGVGLTAAGLFGGFPAAAAAAPLAGGLTMSQIPSASMLSAFGPSMLY